MKKACLVHPVAAFTFDHESNEFVAKHSVPFFTRYRSHIFYDSQSPFSLFNDTTPTFRRSFDLGCD